MTTAEDWMDRAIDLARTALGTTAPNPAVGAVLVRDGVCIGSGYTCPVPGDHAEVVALAAARSAGHDPRDSTMFVTLEPCCHHGRTAPCTDALIAAGVARVIVGVQDEYPPMQGKGLRQLRDAGIEVELGLREEECSELIVGFQRVVCAGGLPEVTLKAAISADGHIATVTGESQWITGEGARSDGHRLRAGHDAIVVGIETVLADDPRLTCRIEGGTDPVPVVLDTHLRIPRDAALFASGQRPIIVCGPDAEHRELPGDVVCVARGAAGGVDVGAALKMLGERGLHRVLVEGGGRVHRSMLDAGVVDVIHLYVAGTVIPGGRSWVGGEPLASLQQAERFGPPRVSVVGDDVRLTYRLVRPEET